MGRPELTDDAYFEWLYDKIRPFKDGKPSRNLKAAALIMYRTQFTYFVPNDDNRAQDGIEIREQFVADTNYEVDQLWLDLECSVFEMLIALSERASYESCGEPSSWFRLFISHMGLNLLLDAGSPNHEDFLWQVQASVHRLLERNYYPDGHNGGLFPLEHAPSDQTQVEIWYQMSAYLLENPNPRFV